MTQKQALNLWLTGANDAFDTAKKLYSAKKLYQKFQSAL
jgi:hypothetical protein